MEEAIHELVSTRCVEQCSECPVVCSPLSVVVNRKGKKRLVLDLRYVNQFILMKKFKYEGLNMVPQLFCKGDFFHHVRLKVGLPPRGYPCRLLAFSWFFMGYSPKSEMVCFQSTPLWFGLSLLCFYKLVKVPSKALETHGSLLYYVQCI